MTNVTMTRGRTRGEKVNLGLGLYACINIVRANNY